MTHPYTDRPSFERRLVLVAAIVQIKELRDDGLTLQQIGDRAGVSKERIRQLLR